MMEFGDVHFWGTVLIGILAGFIAHKVMGGSGGIIWNLIVGVIGSYIGFYIANKKFATGIYFIQLKTESGVGLKRMMVK